LNTQGPNLHSKLKRRVIVDCIIQTNEPLHVGVGRETISVSEVDLPTMKDTKDKPIIPGSSIKGALRAHVSRLLWSLDESQRENLFGVRKVEATQEELKNFQSGDTEEKKRLFDTVLGVVDKLFGAMGYASPLRVTDAKLKSRSGTVDTEDTIERTHVRIDNDLDRAAGQALFDVQAVPEDRQFSFKLIYNEFDDTVTQDANKVFYEMLLKQLGNGLEMFLGGMKSRGYGLCVIKANQLLSYTPENLALGEKPKPVTDIPQYVENILNSEEGGDK